MPRPIAILCSDMHFSHRPPVARSAEPDWYAAMERAWRQVGDVASEFRVPIIVAGDIFDRWTAPPELINHVIRMFRDSEVLAIPGQHDLPNHNYADIGRSAYGTLMEADVIQNMEVSVGGIYINGCLVWAFPWGAEIEPVPKKDGELKIAVVHKYIWNGLCKYQGAPDQAHTSAFKSQLAGYDVAVFGDNHKGFIAGLIGGECKCTVVNCGGFMGRTIDERDYRPRFYVLDDGGMVDTRYLDTSEDKWLDPKDVGSVVDDALDLKNVVAGLESLGGDALNFADVLNRYLTQHEVEAPVRRLVTEALDRGQGDGA